MQKYHRSTKMSFIRVIAILAFVSTTYGADSDEVARIVLSGGSTQRTEMFAALGANADSAAYELDKLPSTMELVSANDGCEADDFERTDPAAATTVLVTRGKCTFSTKALNAASAGARAMIIANNIESLYANQTTGILRDGCDVNCAISADVEGTCIERCPSRSCALVMNPLTSNEELSFCCLNDDVSSIQLNRSVSIPTVFVGISEGKELFDALRIGDASIAIDMRPLNTFSASMVAIWFVGVLTMALASFRGAWTVRSETLMHTNADDRASAVSKDDDDAEDQNPDVQTVMLSSRQVLLYLILASSVLLVVYLLVSLGADWIVMMIIVMFCFASVSALSITVLEPLVNGWCPRMNRVRVFAISVCGETVTASLGELLVMFVSCGIVIWWFLERHANYAWIVQNILGACICCTFAIAVQLPNLKVATLLLGLFLLYDVTMVFLTPLIFNSSVMLTVATAGGSDSQSSAAGTNTCEHHYGERMPMLFMVPRSDWAGGYSMLGLGDVILPTTLVNLMLRVDYRTTGGPFAGMFGAPRPISDAASGASVLFRIGYFPILVFCYGFGLFLAFLANTLHLTFNGVRGQPALLYLVPCTLFPSIWMAWRRHELASIWTWDEASASRGPKLGDYESVDSGAPGLVLSSMGTCCDGNEDDNGDDCDEECPENSADCRSRIRRALAATSPTTGFEGKSD